MTTPNIGRRSAAAFAACRELIEGDGTSACLQRTIDLARVALGLDPMDVETRRARGMNELSRRVSP